MSITNVVPQEFAGAPPRDLTLAPRRAWQRLSLRAKLLIVFVVIDLIAAFVVGGVTIMRARTSTRVEIAASMALAETLVAETIRLAQQQSSITPLAAYLPARQRLLRHVRLSVRNAAHLPVAIGSRADGFETAREADPVRAPVWFAALIAPPVERRELPVMASEQRIGSVLITGVADDEIVEAWENFVALTAGGVALNVAMVVLLFLLFGRVLAPLSDLARGLHDLEGRNYRVRLARPDARELGAIADRFNSLAQALDMLRARNNELNRRLITAQDDERRHTALELHDEVGPCLFGLKANAASIATLVEERPGAPAGLTERARDMLAIIDHLQTINRSLLNRLRPMALGHVPLGDLLAEVVRERARQHPDLQLVFTPGVLQPSYGEPIDLTIYRCVQESLTNTIRHAQAGWVDIAFGEIDQDGARPFLSLQIHDDGCGIDRAAPLGRGLRGMQERVQALGGSCVVEGAAGRGTQVHITIPIGAHIDGGAA